MPYVIRSQFVINDPAKPQPLVDGYIIYDETGVREVGKFNKEAEKLLIKDLGASLEVIKSESLIQSSTKDEPIPKHKALLLPGFIKAHGHDHESPIIGIARDVPLTTWLDESVNPFTSYIQKHMEELTTRFGYSPNYLSFLKSRMDDVYYGITASLSHLCNYAKNFADELVAANDLLTTHLTIAVGSQDRNFYKEVLDQPYAKAVDRLNNYLSRHGQNPHVRFIPGPDQDFSNSPEMLKALKKWAEEQKSLIHIHSSEEKKTTAWFKEKYQVTPVEYLSEIGFLDDSTLIAHQVQCTENDLDLLQKNRVGIVHNPTANTILGSGMPPVLEMQKRNIRVAIATDGSGSSDNQNIIAAARLAAQYQKAYHQDPAVLPVKKLLQMITTIPAEMLRLNKGSLLPGKDADMVLIDLSKPNLIPSYPETILENLFWASDGSEVNTVVVGGKTILQDKKYLTVDESKVFSQIEELAGGLFKYKAKAKKIKGTGAHQ